MSQITPARESGEPRTPMRSSARRVLLGALVAASTFGVATATGALDIAAAPVAAQSLRAGWSAYVVNSASGTVTPIDVATGTAGAPIPVGDAPVAIAITPDARTAYIANGGSDDVTPIDVATGTARTPIPVGDSPAAIAITPDGATAYVVNAASDDVTPIDVATGTPGASIPVGAAPQGVAITPDGATAYVVNDLSNDITPIDVATGTAATPIPVGDRPYAIAITPDGTTAYVVNAFFPGAVTPVDLATGTPGTPIAAGAFPVAVAITPDGTTAYITDVVSNSVTPIDLATGTAGAPILVDLPVAVAITPDGATAYVADALSESVTPIDVATITAGTPIPVGEGPFAIAVTPDQAPTATVTVSPAPPGSASTFDASGSTLRFGTIASYGWDFGDGTAATTSTATTTHVYAAPGTYTATVTATSSGGTSTTQVFTGQTMSRNGGPQATASTNVAIPGVPTEQLFNPVPPTRIADTRDGTGGVARAPLSPGEVLRVSPRIAAGMPKGDVGGVALNVTAAEPLADGYLTVYPCTDPAPTSSNVNYVAGQIAEPNAVIVGVEETTADVCITTSAHTDVIVDVFGWFSDDAGFRPLTPERIADTRDPGIGPVVGPLRPGEVLTVQVSDGPGVVGAAALNVTAANTTAPGYLTVYPCGGLAPYASNVNYEPGQAGSPNAVLSGLDDDGQVCITTSAPVDVVVDLTAEFAADAPFVGLTPARIADTRDGNGGVPNEKLQPGETLEVQVNPGDEFAASGAALNVTATEADGNGYLTVFPCDRPRPYASNVNYTTEEQASPNAVVTGLSEAGSVCIAASAPVHVVVDLSGLFLR